MDQERGWAARCAATIGSCVARYRAERKLSAQQLADTCSLLGMPSISRVVITKLENGRREAVSTAELAVLAMALDVAPVLLLFPLGHTETVEVLPGLDVDPYAAIQWFGGSTSDPARPAVSQELAGGEIALWNEHLQDDGQLSIVMRTIADEQALIGSATTEEQAQYQREIVERLFEYTDTTVKALRRVRLNMRERGLILPQLHPETARLLGPEPGGEADRGSR